MEYYVFEDEQTALDAELYIRNIGEMPIVGVNAKTGETSPSSQQTVKWADPWQRSDGKWVFKRVPQSDRDEVPQSIKDLFDSTFPHIIDVKNDSWY